MLELDKDAADDLRGLRATRPGDVAKLAALIEQLKADPQLRNKLTTHRFGEGRDDDINVRRWDSITRREERLPVWRLKWWALEDDGLRYRLPYIFNWREQRFVILAVVPKENMNYDDPNDPLRRRVVARVRTSYPDI